ncbi:MAG: sodium-dependent transporter [Pseudomonadales bacterium]|jgi:NSS family neurotransmitter:Na+ symporter|nr:sodium-dependent transporter [Pseudomonadales bacterium]MDA0761355.1 sodium-dependent transporter [Pseudomonadota bacterium]
MLNRTESNHGMWSSRLMFILAAAGSAVGLGNIWRFPYLAGENGGGVFVLAYLVCIGFIGLPILISEILLGRAGRQSPIGAMVALADSVGVSRRWSVIGWMGALAGFMILSFYGVIAGWAMAYVPSTLSGTFVSISAIEAERSFEAFISDPWQVVGWQSLFMLLTIFIAARGVGRGLETTVRYLMPALFGLLILLLVYSAVTTGEFIAGLTFLFQPDFSRFNTDSLITAMGQAFFTLSLGMGAIMAYGAYMPKGSSIVGTATTIALLDTTVALMSGMVIFPLVFANGLESSAGPGLMFITLPIAFGQMAGGQIFGTLFFVLVTFAAITSSISLLEPAVAWVVEKTKLGRARSAMLVGVIAWALGLGSAFSFNIGSDWTIANGMTFFDTMDYVSNNILLPLGGILIAVFASWRLGQDQLLNEMSEDRAWIPVWRFLTRFLAPAGVLIVFVVTIF